MKKILLAIFFVPFFTNDFIFSAAPEIVRPAGIAETRGLSLACLKSVEEAADAQDVRSGSVDIIDIEMKISKALFERLFLATLFARDQKVSGTESHDVKLRNYFGNNRESLVVLGLFFNEIFSSIKKKLAMDMHCKVSEIDPMSAWDLLAAALTPIAEKIAKLMIKEQPGIVAGEAAEIVFQITKPWEDTLVGEGVDKTLGALASMFSDMDMLASIFDDEVVEKEA